MRDELQLLRDWSAAHLPASGAVECVYEAAAPGEWGTTVVRFDFSSGGWLHHNGFTVVARDVLGQYSVRQQGALLQHLERTPVGADCAVSDAIPAVAVLDMLRRPAVVRTVHTDDQGSLIVECEFPGQTRCADPSASPFTGTASWRFVLTSDGRVSSIDIKGELQQELITITYGAEPAGIVRIADSIGRGSLRLAEATWHPSAPKGFLDVGEVNMLAASRLAAQRATALAQADLAPGRTEPPAEREPPEAGYSLSLAVAGVVLLLLGGLVWWRRRA
ncbi:MAG: hypothetical protein WAZ94_14315 [Phycisphaerales bacterium]